MSSDPSAPRRTNLRKADLDSYLTKLLKVRSRITGEVLNLRDEGHDTGAMPDPSDLSADVSAQDLTFQMVETEENVIQEIDAAIERIRVGSYGICEMSGKPIPKARLNVIPWTRYRVECAEMVEKNGGRRET
ncbi:General stress protein 16O [Planctomycetes bacterium Pan216]|uniref:General stress protein 16O n=1 Tax=Kolteria novifilia TaxID=2527975 RepID=A0A518BB21_9BACT|nr:General stress protein 16O [Planctomycetes bacterium Pan216]